MLPESVWWPVSFAALLAVSLALAWAVAGGIAATYVFLGAFTYGVVHTVWLKRRSVWNIVVGGLAGSFAVLAGAAAVDPRRAARSSGAGAVPVDAAASGLAAARRGLFAQAHVPMLPVSRRTGLAAGGPGTHGRLALLSLAPFVVRVRDFLRNLRRSPAALFVAAASRWSGRRTQDGDGNFARRLSGCRALCSACCSMRSADILHGHSGGVGIFDRCVGDLLFRRRRRWKIGSIRRRPLKRRGRNRPRGWRPSPVTDASGKAFRLSDYRGRPLVISLIYTSVRRSARRPPNITVQRSLKRNAASGDDRFSRTNFGIRCAQRHGARMASFRTQQGQSAQLAVCERRSCERSSQSSPTSASPARQCSRRIRPCDADHDCLMRRARSIARFMARNFPLQVFVEPLETVFGLVTSSLSIESLTDRIRFICTVYDANVGRYRTSYAGVRQGSASAACRFC